MKAVTVDTMPPIPPTTTMQITNVLSHSGTDLGERERGRERERGKECFKCF